MIKVVSLQMSGCNGIWKKQLAASGEEKNCSPTQLCCDLLSGRQKIMLSFHGLIQSFEVDTDAGFGVPQWCWS